METSPALSEQDLIPTPEIVRNQKLRDFSGLDENFVREQTEYILEYAKRMVVFPDLGPTEKGVVPTGSVTEIDMLKHPDWLKLVSGADMGCGMLLASLDSSLQKKDFQNDQASLDKLRDRIEGDSSLSLGGGNHFIDFVADDEGKVSVMIHTGAYRDKQKGLTTIVEQAKINGNWEEATKEYLKNYQDVIDSAEQNRTAILKAISEIYGECTVQSHEAHNTLDINTQDNTVRIYKGAIHVTDTTKRLLLPSSMADIADFYIPGPTIGEDTLWGAPHGTGRAMSRRDMKIDDEEENIPDLMRPTGMRIPLTEGRKAYRTSVKTEQTMLDNKLMILDEMEDIIQLHPIATLVHLKIRNPETRRTKHKRHHRISKTTSKDS